MRGLSIAAVLYVAGCVQVDYIDMSPTEATLKRAGEEKTIEAKCMARTGARQASAQAKIVWSSLDPSIATVSKGVVKAVKSGRTEIVAKYNEVEARTSVTVLLAEKLVVEPKELTLKEGEPAAQVTVKVYGAEGQLLADRKPVFTSSDSKVVQAGGGGLLPLDPGSAIVNVQVEGLTSSLQVIVVPEKGNK
jgi:hypothetical protein